MSTTSRTSQPRTAPHGLTRRQILIGGAALVAAACGGDGPDGGAHSDGGANQAPAWTVIPDQSWVVGTPVLFDLRDYCSDADGDAVTFSLVGTLPPGLTLVGSVIQGTPTEVTAATMFTVTADDGRA